MTYNFKIRGVIGSYWWGITAEDVIDWLGKNKDRDVEVAICSPGGSVQEGLEIYQAFKDHGRVNAHIVGMTASIATIVAMGAKTVDMVKGSLMLIHNSSEPVDEYTAANKEQMEIIIAKYQRAKNRLKTIDELMASIYAEKSGKEMSFFLDKMKDEAWMTSAEALSLGLIDSVREDRIETKAVACALGDFEQDEFKMFRLPDFPDRNIDRISKPENNTEIKLPEAGQPETEEKPGFIARVAAAVKELFTKQDKEKMDKKYQSIAGLLGKEVDVQDGRVTLTAEDMAKLEDGLKPKAEAQPEAEAETKPEVKAEIDVTAEADKMAAQMEELKKAIALKDEELKALKAAPGAKAEDKPEEEATIGTASTADSKKLYQALFG